MKLMEMLEYLNIVAFGGESAQRLQHYDVTVETYGGLKLDIKSVTIDFKEKSIFLLAGKKP
jgi:hypothetical protein